MTIGHPLCWLPMGSECTGLVAESPSGGWEPRFGGCFQPGRLEPGPEPEPGRAGRAAGRLGLPVPPSGQRHKRHSPSARDAGDAGKKVASFLPQPCFLSPHPSLFIHNHPAHSSEGSSPRGQQQRDPQRLPSTSHRLQVRENAPSVRHFLFSKHAEKQPRFSQAWKK